MKNVVGILLLLLVSFAVSSKPKGSAKINKIANETSFDKVLKSYDDSRTRLELDLTVEQAREIAKEKGVNSDIVELRAYESMQGVEILIVASNNDLFSFYAEICSIQNTSYKCNCNSGPITKIGIDWNGDGYCSANECTLGCPIIGPE